ncbi:unnamed protein product [Vicia faba]|uniref:Uncharacterized protein n=1 Tax=Vicia faba TaxID=3906 RepID=A0AAV1B3Y1_VICFA|nr:unnamed protein product [Vicia faba]
MIWRIGNGEKVRIWGDNLLPEILGFKLHNIADSANLEDRVCELVDRDTRCWNSGLVQRNLIPLEAAHVLNLPISMRLLEDEKIQFFEKGGNLCQDSISYAPKK